MAGPRSLAHRSVSAAMWTYAGTVLRLAAQLGFTALLARVLGPLPFGIVGMAIAVMGAVSFLAEQGLGSALVQRERLTDDQVRIAFTRLLVSSVGLATLGVVAAPLIAEYFREPRLLRPMQVLSLTFVPSCFVTIGGAMLRRAMRIKALQLATLVSYVLPYAGLGVPLALAGYGLWSLVAAMVGNAVLAAALMYAFARHPVGLLWAGGTAGLSRYGWRTATDNVASWLTENLPQFLVGRIFGAAPLGLYNAAYNLVRTPLGLLVGGGIDVLFTAGARADGEGEFRRRAFTVSASLVGVIMLPTFVSAAVLAPTLVLTLYGPRWTEAALLLPPFALAMPVIALAGTGGAVLNAAGLVTRDLRVQLVTLIVLFATLLIATAVSLETVAWVILAVMIFRTVLISREVLESLGLRWRDLWHAGRGGVVLGLCLPPCLYALDALMVEQAWSRPVVLLVDMIVGIALLAAGVLIVRRWLPHEARWTLAQALRRVPARLVARRAALFE